MKLKKWWAKQSNTDKAVYGLSAFCVASLLFMLITGLLVPDITFLSLEKNNFQIDEKTSNIIIKGQSEPNAKVFISSDELKLDRVPLSLENNGSFQYELKIPVDVSEAKLNLISKVPKKYEVSQNIVIQRPLTFLAITPTNKLKYGEKTVYLEGKSDPNADITISSNMTFRNSMDLQSYLETAFDDPVMNNITLNADSNGFFSKSFFIPLNSTSAFFNITAKSAGKREVVQSQNITRDFDVFPPVYKIFDVYNDSNSSKMMLFNGSDFNLTYPNFWQKKSYKNVGKDARLYLTYENDVECIVWYGKMDKEFGNSLESYRQTQDNYLRSWWRATEVFEQTIDYGNVKGIRAVYKCQQNPIFSNNIPSPFYIDRTTLTKDNKNVYELQLMIEGNYYENNDYLIEKTVQSFNLN